LTLLDLAPCTWSGPGGVRGDNDCCPRPGRPLVGWSKPARRRPGMLVDVQIRADQHVPEQRRRLCRAVVKSAPRRRRRPVATSSASLLARRPWRGGRLHGTGCPWRGGVATPPPPPSRRHPRLLPRPPPRRPCRPESSRRIWARRRLPPKHHVVDVGWVAGCTAQHHTIGCTCSTPRSPAHAPDTSGVRSADVEVYAARRLRAWVFLPSSEAAVGERLYHLSSASSVPGMAVAWLLLFKKLPPRDAAIRGCPVRRDVDEEEAWFTPCMLPRYAARRVELGGSAWPPRRDVPERLRPLGPGLLPLPSHRLLRRQGPHLLRPRHAVGCAHNGDGRPA
jgi:hypothetical protein